MTAQGHGPSTKSLLVGAGFLLQCDSAQVYFLSVFALPRRSTFSLIRADLPRRSRR